MSFNSFDSSTSSDIPNPLETLRRIKQKWSSYAHLFTSDEFKLLQRNFKFLKWNFKLLDIILNLRMVTGASHFVGYLRTLFQHAGADLLLIYSCQVIPESHDVSNLQNKLWHVKLSIRSEYPFYKLAFKPIHDYDATVIPNFVLEFIDTVIENLSDLLKLDDPSSSLHVGGLMDQVEKASKELKFLRSFVCFVLDRCVELEVQHTFCNHVVEVAWHTIMVTWLYLPTLAGGSPDPYSPPAEGYPLFVDQLPNNLHLRDSTAFEDYIFSHQLDSIEDEDYPLFDRRDSTADEGYSLFGLRDSTAHEGYPLFSDLLESNILPIEPDISKIYIDVLKAIKLRQSQWYPVIQIKYVVDCEVGFVETLLHILEELPFILSGIDIKEMLDFLRAHLLTHALEFHLQDIDHVIVDAGILVYSLNKKEDDLDFRVEIQNLQAMIYLVTRKTFLLQSNLPGIDGVRSADFILGNMEKLSLYSNSVDSFKSQLYTIQKELKFFQTVVKTQDALQHFVTHTNGLVYEVEYVLDACKKKDFPDWCLFLWILNIGEDIRVLMAEVAEVQENTAFDLVLHSITNAAPTHASSRFAGMPSTNEEMVGFKDVTNELRGKLIKRSVNLDVISIVGMPGLGKTTLANELYFDELVVSYFDIRIHCCVSQEYIRKDLLLALLHDVIDDTAKLDREAEDELADRLRKLLKLKRYLVLVDDVWTRSAWDDLQSCFPKNNKGSRIILTTRHLEVASYAKHVSDPHKLRFFSFDESWTLLQNKLFNKERCPQVLEAVGKSIAQKCGGLPLSIILVAGILTRMKKEKHCWEQVSKNLGPNIQTQSEGTLDLSYQNLPHYLKPCFLYMGVFQRTERFKSQN